MGTPFNLLVYNIKRSINILGVSDLIAKLKKWNSSYSNSLFCLLTNYFRLSKDSITNQQCALFAVERLYCRLEYVLFVKLWKEVLQPDAFADWRTELRV
jgi:hypothetical protein